MTTINTMDDFARILRENPDWADTVRSLLLSKELLELPQTFAKFAEATDRRLENLERGQKELRTGQKGILVRLGNLEEGQKRLIDEIGAIKGTFTYNIAYDEMRTMLEDMGFEHRHTLTRDEVRQLVSSSDRTGLPIPDLRSFRRADFIVEVANESGQIGYVVAEASFTVDERDVTRAVRNAEYMTRFTGLPGWSAVMGVRRVNDVADAINSGQVYWFEIDEARLVPE
jgi:hypothetical protein